MEKISQLPTNVLFTKQINQEEQTPAECIKLFAKIMNRGHVDDTLTNEFLHQITDLSQSVEHHYKTLQSIQKKILYFQNL